jgi:hypothetical protein
VTKDQRTARTPSWVARELAGADRAILLVIILEQIFVSVSLLWMAAMVPYKGGAYPWVVLYSLWGICSGVSLCFSGPLPRIGAFLWHAVFIIYVLTHLEGSTLKDWTVQWALYDILAVFYLAVTAFLKLRSWKKKTV